MNRLPTCAWIVSTPWHCHQTGSGACEAPGLAHAQGCPAASTVRPCPRLHTLLVALTEAVSFLPGSGVVEFRFLPEQTKIVGYGRSPKTIEQLHKKISTNLPGTEEEKQKFLKTVCP